MSPSGDDTLFYYETQEYNDILLTSVAKNVIASCLIKVRKCTQSITILARSPEFDLLPLRMVGEVPIWEFLTR
jgi:hypothetical protein